RHRPRPPAAQCSAVRADHAAADHLLGQQDGQDRNRRGLAQRRRHEPLRVLAVLAQLRRRRRRPPAQAVYRTAARCDPTSRGPQGARAQRGEKVLATEATPLLHGRTAAEQAAETARRTFEEGALAETLPTVEIPHATLAAGLSVLDAAVHVGLVSSKGDARRQIKGGGLRVNDVAVTDEKMVLTPRDLTPEGVIKLSLGRKRHVLLRPV